MSKLTDLASNRLYKAAAAGAEFAALVDRNRDELDKVYSVIDELGSSIDRDPDRTKDQINQLRKTILEYRAQADRLGPRGSQLLTGLTRGASEYLARLAHARPAGSLSASQIDAALKNTAKKAKDRLALASIIKLEADLDSSVDRLGLGSKLAVRGLGYGLSAAGGGALGALVAGKGNRLLGGSIGVAAGLLANYLRRKSYYGKTVKW